MVGAAIGQIADTETQIEGQVGRAHGQTGDADDADATDHTMRNDPATIGVIARLNERQADVHAMDRQPGRTRCCSRTVQSQKAFAVV